MRSVNTWLYPHHGTSETVLKHKLYITPSFHHDVQDFKKTKKTWGGEGGISNNACVNFLSAQKLSFQEIWPTWKFKTTVQDLFPLLTTRTFFFRVAGSFNFACEQKPICCLGQKRLRFSFCLLIKKFKLTEFRIKFRAIYANHLHLAGLYFQHCVFFALKKLSCLAKNVFWPALQWGLLMNGLTVFYFLWYHNLIKRYNLFVS